MNDDEMLKETYRLTLENNRMLRAMRRSAFWGGVIRFVIYAALLIVPLWFYLTYLAPIMRDMLEMYSQVQGTGARASAQFSDFQNMLKQYQELLGGSN
jgi:hypothetical protein